MEPEHVATLLVFSGGLLVLAALATRLSSRVGVPSLLFFLLLGLLTRVQPLHAFEPPGARLTFDIGTVALVVILFDGGLHTAGAVARSVAAPALSLALVGTFLTATVVALLGLALGLAGPTALLMGAIVSSTDVAAVMSTLRNSHAELHERVGLTLELESAFNDPMAVILTLAATDAVMGGHPTMAHALVDLGQELGLGAGAGLAIAWLGRRLLLRAELPVSGLYPVLTVALSFGAFGLATLIGGSGFLAVVVAAIALAAGRIPFRAGILRIHDGLAWLAQITMFLLLGFTVDPPALVTQLARGGALALGLALLARPLAVFISLAPFRFTRRERLFMAITGLRGAVPIVLATYPLIRGVPGARQLFNLVFVMVGFNNIFPGAVAKPLAQWLGIRRHMPPPPPAGIEMVSRADFDGEFVSYYISSASAVAGAQVQELPLPESCLVMLIVRRSQLLAPRGPTRLEPGDHVFVFTKPADRSLMDLLFGYAEE